MTRIEFTAVTGTCVYDTVPDPPWASSGFPLNR